MFFGLKLRAAMLCRPVIDLFGPETANALGRAISNAGSDWKMLILRLKSRQLSVNESAAVAAAWIARHATPDRLGFDLPRAMTYSSNVLSNSLFEAQLWDRHSAVRGAMEAEGLTAEDKAQDPSQLFQSSLSPSIESDDITVPITFTSVEINEQAYALWLERVDAAAISRDVPIVFSVLSFAERNSLAFAVQALRSGYGVILKQQGDDEDLPEWDVRVKSRLVPKWENILKLSGRLELLAEPHNGVLSSWHCLGSEQTYIQSEGRAQRCLPSITDLVNSYLTRNPGFLVGRAEAHPAILALTHPLKDWLIDRFGNVESYWTAMLIAAKIWFRADKTGREFKIFCTLLDAEANVWWHGNDSLQAVYTDFASWKRAISTNCASDNRVGD